MRSLSITRFVRVGSLLSSTCSKYTTFIFSFANNHLICIHSALKENASIGITTLPIRDSCCTERLPSGRINGISPGLCIRGRLPENLSVLWVVVSILLITDDITETGELILPTYLTRKQLKFDSHAAGYNLTRASFRSLNLSRWRYNPKPPLGCTCSTIRTKLSASYDLCFGVFCVFVSIHSFIHNLTIVRSFIH